MMKSGCLNLISFTFFKNNKKNRTKKKKVFKEFVENIAELFVEFFVEKLREKNNMITTRPLALVTGLKRFIILVFCYKIFTENFKKYHNV
jgi:hypothetical protein